jgi:putative oxidoreductase
VKAALAAVVGRPAARKQAGCFSHGQIPASARLAGIQAANDHHSANAGTVCAAARGFRWQGCLLRHRLEDVPMRKADCALTDPVVLLRVLSGLFYAPHVLFKLNNMTGSATFFGRILPFPEVMLYLALAAEIACLFGLTLNILVKWLGLVSFGIMAIALYATLKTKGALWLWNLGGVEYLVFWGLTSLALGARAWKQEQAEYGRVSLLFPALRQA